MLRNGVEFLMIPGPTNVPAEVLRAMHRPVIDIYQGPIIEMTDSILADLKRLFRTESAQVYIYIGNGHATWDAALTNVISRGDKLLVLEAGFFATEWGRTASFLGADVEVLPGSFRAAVDPEAVRARLAADTNHEIKAIMVAQVDTASGVVNDIEAIRRAIDAAGHPALFMVDLIASLGCMRFEMDTWGVDVAIAAAQKGLMTPAGLGFVAANPKAHQASERADLKVRYFDWAFRNGPANYHKFCGTPPEQNLFALRAALDLILAEGLDSVWRRHSVLARAVRAAGEVWAQGGVLDFNITTPAERSDSVTTFLLPGQAEALRALTANSCGVTLGTTIGPISGQGFRIGHMGHVNAPMILGTLGVIEAGLQALGIPHGAGGVGAAATVIAEAVAA